MNDAFKATALRENHANGNMEGSTFRLEELPADVLNRILDFILPISAEIVMPIHNEAYRDCYSLCCNHSKLYSLFKSRLKTVSVDFYAPISDSAFRAFGHLISPFVEKLIIPGFYGVEEDVNPRRLEYFFECLEQKRNRITELCIAPSRARFLSSVLARFGCLSHFSLQAITISGMLDRILNIALPASFLRNLRYLSLSEAKFSSFDVLLGLISIPGRGLSHLKLSNIFFVDESNRPRTFSDGELLQIGEICPNITHVLLSGLLNCTCAGLRNFLMLLKNLSAFVFAYPLTGTPGDCVKLFSNCTSLKHLSLESANDHENLTRALGPLSNVLKTLEITMDSREDVCHRFFVSWRANLQFPQLRRLKLCFLGVAPDFERILGNISCQLEFLHIYLSEWNGRTEYYFHLSSLWRAISKFKMLQTLSLVMRIKYPAKEYPYYNESLDEMFYCIGTTLENFVLDVTECGRPLLKSGHPNFAERIFSSVSLSISKHCKNIKIFDFSAPSMMYRLNHPRDRQKCARLGIRLPNIPQNYGKIHPLPKSPCSF